ncbi:MAG TPA: hypothetical protein VM802_00660 [Chitinophaga sp.]|uniref:hypothetical protein n=1 Tax=Chitinophaga sp. TaxID=1869181 RepID=UPI002BCF419A|nr:hypothetical protein [Chitinophaga sp.]HVI43341.1 hypothetical protein [Chitinophaga sp.]
MLMNPVISRKPAIAEDTGYSITLQQSLDMTQGWQQQYPDAVRSFMYGRRVFEQLLNVPGCESIRIFNGINQENKQALIFVAVNDKGGNILSYFLSNEEGLFKAEAPILDGGIPCPPICPADPFAVYPQPVIKSRKSTGFPEVSGIGTFISLNEARQMIHTWQHQQPEGVKSVLFGRHAFDAMLTTPDCDGVCVFNALDEQQSHSFILLAVNRCAQSLHAIIEGEEAGPGPIGGGRPCPPSSQDAAQDLSDL